MRHSASRAKRTSACRLCTGRMPPQWILMRRRHIHESDASPAGLLRRWQHPRVHAPVIDGHTFDPQTRHFKYFTQSGMGRVLCQNHSATPLQKPGHDSQPLGRPTCDHHPFGVAAYAACPAQVSGYRLPQRPDACRGAIAQRVVGQSRAHPLVGPGPLFAREDIECRNARAKAHHPRRTFGYGCGCNDERRTVCTSLPAF